MLTDGGAAKPHGFAHVRAAPASHRVGAEIRHQPRREHESTLLLFQHPTRCVCQSPCIRMCHCPHVEGIMAAAESFPHYSCPAKDGDLPILFPQRLDVTALTHNLSHKCIRMHYAFTGLFGCINGSGSRLPSSGFVWAATLWGEAAVWSKEGCTRGLVVLVGNMPYTVAPYESGK